MPTSNPNCGENKANPVNVAISPLSTPLTETEIRMLRDAFDCGFEAEYQAQSTDAPTINPHPPKSALHEMFGLGAEHGALEHEDKTARSLVSTIDLEETSTGCLLNVNVWF